MTNVENMPLAKLKELLDRVEREIPKAKAREAAAVREQMRELVTARGLTLSDVMSTMTGGKTRVVPVKYRDPKNATNEWSGRGRAPRWFDRRHPEKFRVAA